MERENRDTFLHTASQDEDDNHNEGLVPWQQQSQLKEKKLKELVKPLGEIEFHIAFTFPGIPTIQNQTMH